MGGISPLLTVGVLGLQGVTLLAVEVNYNSIAGFNVDYSSNDEVNSSSFGYVSPGSWTLDTAAIASNVLLGLANPNEAGFIAFLPGGVTPGLSSIFLYTSSGAATDALFASLLILYEH